MVNRQICYPGGGSALLWWLRGENSHDKLNQQRWTELAREIIDHWARMEKSWYMQFALGLKKDLCVCSIWLFSLELARSSDRNQEPGLIEEFCGQSGTNFEAVFRFKPAGILTNGWGKANYSLNMFFPNHALITYIACSIIFNASQKFHPKQPHLKTAVVLNICLALFRNA